MRFGHIYNVVTLAKFCPLSAKFCPLPLTTAMLFLVGSLKPHFTN